MQSNKRNIPFIRPNFPGTDEIRTDYAAILKSNHFTNFGPKEREFAAALARYIGQGVHVSTVNNATSGLILALQALCGFGDEKKQVIMPSFTFAAGPEAAVWTKHVPYFIDIDADTLQPSITQAEAYLASHKDKVAAILFCNILGVGADNIAKWEALAKRHGKPLIIDSAAGFGSTYDGAEKVGARGDCEVFSFHATKPFSIGEGGAVVSRSKDTIDILNKLQNFGFGTNRDSEYIGMNGKLQEINAAIGLRQLEDFNARLKTRKKTLKAYVKLLAGAPFTVHVNAENSSVCFASFLADTSQIADSAYQALLDGGVQARRYYNPPLHKHPAFRHFPTAKNLTVTEDVCARILSLPVHDNMDIHDVEYVVQRIRGI